VDIPYIFEQQGEAGFRERERETLAELVTIEPLVLATGGGAILAPENRKLLAANGVVVFLDTSISQQLHRVGSGRGRPLLKGDDLLPRLQELRRVRDPLYREIADVTVFTDSRRVSRVAEMILQQLGRTPPG
jgi:shikimate kinase